MVTMERTIKRRSSCGRGVLKLTSWSPLPRPGQNIHQEQHKQSDASSSSFQNSVKNTDNRANTAARKAPAMVKTSNKSLRKVLAKYSYKANPERPGGFEELTIKQGEHIYFHEKNPNNPYWVKAENEQGEIGYVPANYIVEIESKPSQLPWLENKRLLKEAEKDNEVQNSNRGFGAPSSGSLPPKKYVSAYNSQESAEASEFGCELCGKTFNGPKPYRLHMSSKAHKEEVEAQKYR